MLHPSQTPSLFRNWLTLCTAFHLLVSSTGFTQENLDIRSSHLNPSITRDQTAGSGFTRIHKDYTGIDFQNLLKKEHIKKYIYTGAGACVEGCTR